MSLEKQRYVLLNSKKVPIKGMVQKRAVTPWAARIATGELKYQDYTPSSRQVWTSLKGGIGLEKWVAGSDDRYWWAEGLEGAYNKTCLSGYVTTLGAFGVAPVKIISYASKIWAIGESRIGYWEGSTWFRHKVLDTVNTISSPNATSDAECHTLLNEIKTDYTAHIASTTYHTAADTTNTIAAANASDEATSVALAHELKDDYNAHRSQSGIHPQNDTQNTVTSDDPTNYATAKTCANEIKVDYNHHCAAMAYHDFTAPTDAMVYYDIITGENFLCVAAEAGGSIYTHSDAGTAWATFAHDGSGYTEGAWFTQFDRRVMTLDHDYRGFTYSDVNGALVGPTTNWTRDATFPAVPYTFRDFFVGKNAADEPTLYFLTDDGLYYIDFYTMTYSKTEVSWAANSTAGKVGLYWKGDIYVTTGKGVLKVTQGVVSEVGPDREDGLPSGYQGTIVDMIGLDYWLIIAINGGTGNKSCILRKYITGNAWHPLYVTSAVNNQITCLFYEDGKLYFGEGTNVKYVDLPDETDNVMQFATHEYCTPGERIYSKTDCGFANLKKVALKVEGLTTDCNDTEYFTIWYRINSESSYTSLGTFKTSPHPTALTFPAGGGTAVGLEFNTIQLKVVGVRGATTTTSPKLEALTLVYLPIPEAIYGWQFTADCHSNLVDNKTGKDLIGELITAYETKTLLIFYPDGDPSGTSYLVKIQGMPGAELGEEFGQEGLYQVQLTEVT